MTLCTVGKGGGEKNPLRTKIGTDSTNNGGTILCSHGHILEHS